MISEYEDNRYDFYFINLVDLDMLYGHREDPAGYYDGLKIIDNGLDKLISVLNDDDIIIITGDHGTDPTVVRLITLENMYHLLFTKIT